MASLTPRELELKNQLYAQYKLNKEKFIRDYGADAEKVMIGRSITLAKKMAQKQDQTKIKEMIKKALQGPLEEIDSAAFVQNRKPIVPKPISVADKKEKNPEDVIKMDVPLLIRMLEYAREDAKTDMDLHFAAENLITLCKKDRVLTMDDYDTIITPDEAKND